ncbi:hypothetical protein GM921_09900 [Pedobacter sp. LMG 31464]|uniref:Uncharacterized protein n=1 Tax=Pedobacter planticolens TaxID=2679964 RepID=A0A923IUD6_9SPHI|nr:hypothetical protein [Pedobacter planticolens]MBB2145800.1 hypothetical protein [Pedobacter planticolens]
MEKFPLSTSGLQDLISEMHALPDAQLGQQAESIGNDFSAWIIEHFILDESQINFLHAIDERFIARAATDCKYFLGNRLPISLVKEAQAQRAEPEEGEDRGKLLDLDKKTSSSFSAANGFASSEELIFTISYQNPV